MDLVDHLDVNKNTTTIIRLPGERKIWTETYLPKQPGRNFLFQLNYIDDKMSFFFLSIKQNFASGTRTIHRRRASLSKKLIRQQRGTRLERYVKTGVVVCQRQRIMKKLKRSTLL